MDRRPLGGRPLGGYGHALTVLCHHPRQNLHDLAAFLVGALHRIGIDLPKRHGVGHWRADHRVVLAVIVCGVAAAHRLAVGCDTFRCQPHPLACGFPFHGQAFRRWTGAVFRFGDVELPRAVGPGVGLCRRRRHEPGGTCESKRQNHAAAERMHVDLPPRRPWLMSWAVAPLPETRYAVARREAILFS
jgi:hypothetical protein